MKKIAFVIMAAAVVLGLSSCHKEQPTPNYVGDWYMNHAIIDASVSAMGQEYSESVDTVFNDRTEKYTLTKDNVVRLNGDSIGTYTYDELEGELVVRTDYISNMIGGDQVAQYLPGMDLKNLRFKANFTDSAAKLSYNQADAGTIAIISYSYSVDMKLYFEK